MTRINAERIGREPLGVRASGVARGGVSLVHTHECLVCGGGVHVFLKRSLECLNTTYNTTSMRLCARRPALCFALNLYSKRADTWR
jgi:hypothetical protein